MPHQHQISPSTYCIISSDKQPKLCEFAAASRKGTGLEMQSINIVEAHGGKIRGENNPNGRGTAFTISLAIVK